MMAHDRPGNIRELENAIEHAFVLCHAGLIELRHLPETLRTVETRSGPSFEGTTLAEIEKQVIFEAAGPKRVETSSHREGAGHQQDDPLAQDETIRPPRSNVQEIGPRLPSPRTSARTSHLGFLLPKR